MVVLFPLIFFHHIKQGMSQVFFFKQHLASGLIICTVIGEYSTDDRLVMPEFDQFIADNGAKVALIHRTEQIGERGQEQVTAGLIDKPVDLDVYLDPAFTLKLSMQRAHFHH